MLLSLKYKQRLNFDISEIENFRYRVDDVAQTIGKDVIREARLKELKQEVQDNKKKRIDLESLWGNFVITTMFFSSDPQFRETSSSL